MRVKLAIPSELSDPETKDALDAALESVTRATTPLVARGIVPTAEAAIARGLRWRPEPPGDEHFDLPTTTIARGWGDCDDLAPHHAASLRATGQDPNARAVVKKSGPSTWHAIVERSDGTTDDPSRAAGMRSSVGGQGAQVVGAAPSIWEPMHDGRLTFAAYPLRRGPHPGWVARVDLPDRGMEWTWSNMHAHPTLAGAVIGAAQTARCMAGGCEAVSDRDVDMLGAVQALMQGFDPSLIAEAMDDAGVEDTDSVVGEAIEIGSFLSSLTAPVRHLLAPVAHAYNTISPYTTALFPGMAQVVDPLRAAIETGDPMAVYKSMLIPGAQSGRDVFERNPLGHAAFGALHPLLQNIPGGSTWLAAAAPRNAQAQHPGGGGMVMPGGLDLSSLAASMGLPVPSISQMVPGMPVQSPDSGAVFMRF